MGYALACQARRAEASPFAGCKAAYGGSSRQAGGSPTLSSDGSAPRQYASIGSYRDAFRLLVSFAEKRLKRLPSKLAFEDLGAPLITSFLDELENKRGTAHAVATSDWQRSGRFFVMPRWRLPSIRRSFNECCPFPGNATHDHSLTSWSARKSRRCWPPRRARHGLANATMPSSSRLCKLGCACPN